LLEVQADNHDGRNAMTLSIILILVFEAALSSLQLIIAAYIDPNTGGMLFQVLAVLFGVISGALLLFSGKIKGIYYRMRRRVRGSEDESLEESVDLEEEEE